MSINVAFEFDDNTLSSNIFGDNKVTLKLDDKKVIVAEVAEVAQKALSAVAANYRGLTVAQLDALRKNARNSGVYLRVIRNTLARRAVENTEFACMQDALVGPLILGFSKEDPGAAARLFRDACKQYEQLEVKVIALGGELLDAKKLESVAKLPTRDEALSQMLSVMQAPIAKFVQTMAAVNVKLVRTLDAVRAEKAKAE